jgi:magnesium-transporting ATPase (P-type)
LFLVPCNKNIAVQYLCEQSSIQVPADGLLVQGYSLSINESAMTGESEPVKKDSNQPFLLSGCKVEDGQGTMLVRCLSTLNTFAAVHEPNLFQQNIYHSPSHLVFGTGYWCWHTH